MVPAVHCYRVHGLRLTSDTALPIPEAPIADSTADVTYHSGRAPHPLPAARHSRQDDADDPWVREHWTDHATVVVEFPGWASFEIDDRRIDLLADETADADLVSHLLLDHVVPRVVALRGDLMLHAAGAVGPSGRAHVFLGPTGTGKSTLATALAAAGWPLLDDDGVRVIQLDADGPWCAVPGYAGVRLLPDAAAALIPEVPAERPMYRDSDKRRHTVDGERLVLAPGPVPLGAIHVLERSEAASSPSTEPLRFADGLAAVTHHGFHLADEPAAITRQTFERASAVAAAVPVARLVAPDGLDRIAELVTFLADLDARLCPPIS